MAKIKLATAGELKTGDLFTEVDDDNLVTNEQINENYDAAGLDWWEVTGTGGHADIGWVDARHPYMPETIQRIRGSWDQYVWLRVED